MNRQPAPVESVTGTSTLGELVTRCPGLAVAMERLGLDYCCGGHRTLGEACAELGLDVAAAIAELDARLNAEPGDGDPPAWAVMGVTQLVDHVESTHHRYLWDALPRLSALVDKIVGVHGATHPELHEVRLRLGELRAELEPHLVEEERELFPAIRRSTVAQASSPDTLDALGRALVVMRTDHDKVGEMLSGLRRLTDGYRPPPDGCASYRACYAALAELEADVHVHVHKENNVLFPAVTRLHERVSGTAS
jgi:regulator of cell morphogenesis and NO signaling